MTLCLWLVLWPVSRAVVRKLEGYREIKLIFIIEAVLLIGALWFRKQ